VILPACSSLANMSLAFLCWVTISQLVRHKWRFQDLLWCFAACASVVTVNVTRMSLMALSPAHYHAIHSEAGDMFTSWIILVLTVGISLLGLKREIRG
jgi:exosortase/archaeosortase family protein